MKRTVTMHMNNEHQYKL